MEVPSRETAGARDRLAWIRAVGFRALHAASLWAGVFVASFLLFEVVPGDPARRMLGPNASEEAVARLRKDLGSDRPLAERFSGRVASLARFDLGRSVIDGRKVATEVSEKMAVTARLALLASVLALLLSYLASMGAYVLEAPVLVSIARSGAVVPTYCTGVFAAIILGVWLPVVPLTGYGTGGARWTSLLVPGLVAAAFPTALMAGILHDKVRTASLEGYGRTAEALGFTRFQIYNGTFLRAASATWLVAWVNNLGVVFVASFVLENIFTIPGVGVLLVRAIQQKDYPVLQGIVLFNATFFIVLTWASDVLVRRLDPRLRGNEPAPG